MINKSKSCFNNVDDSITKKTKVMRSIIKSISMLMTSVVLLSSASFAQDKSVMVGGAPMYPTKNIIENAVNSKDHTTLVAAVKAAGLVETLSGAGPFTVFAPTNEAFNKLPKGTVETLVKPENKDALVKILTYHVVPGRISSDALMSMIKKNGGMYKAKTVQGDELTFMMKGKNIFITDEKGGMSKVTISDVNQSNGVIHVVNTVLMPKG
jgi:uncharacterized surface protein with fasciclin (FAS1) repeats